MATSAAAIGLARNSARSESKAGTPKCAAAASRLPGTGSHTATTRTHSPSFGNTVMVGIPVFEAVHARNALELLYFVVPVHALVLFSLATAVNAVTDPSRQAGRRPVLRLPSITYALALGVALSFVVPESAWSSGLRQALAVAIKYLTFFFLGVALGDVPIGGRGRRAILGVTAAKLLVMPAFVYGVFWCVNPAHARDACLIAALPVGINVVSYAASVDPGSTSQVSRSVLLSTLASVVTLTALLMALGYV